jgi:hypothetical protein
MISYFCEENPAVAMNTTTTQPRTPVSTKIVVWLGLLLLTVGSGIAIADHVGGATATTSRDVPAAATGLAVPGSGHLMQFVAMLVVGVCAAGFLVVSRSSARR